MVTRYPPAGAAAVVARFALMVAPVAGGVTVAGTVQVTPAGAPSTAQLNVTLPVSPFSDFTCNERAAVAPALTERSPAVKEVRLKSFTESVTALERTMPNA